MCGILGVYNSYVSKDILKICGERLVNRGPDGGASWNDDMCYLAHRRLSILDLSDNGKQPMLSNCQRYVITYNGEIYNYLEIKKELQDRGYTFYSNCDTEVILNAYIEYGEKCVEQFNGMWALGIYDRREKTIFLSRDRFGIKPLFWSRIGEGYAFASEMKALTPMIENITVNERILRGNIDNWSRYESTQECLINEIHRLPAGYNAYIKNDEIQLERWWNTLENIPEIPERYEEQVEVFRDLFFDSCKIRMRSDVSLGTALSGGLDSSATICTMAHIAQGSKADDRINRDFQHAYIATFPNTIQDEKKYSDIVVNMLNLKNTEVCVDARRGIDNILKYQYDFEEVWWTSPIPMMQLYEGMRRNGTVVTLDGHGADELFGGYVNDIIFALLDVQGNAAEIEKILDTYFEAQERVEKITELKKAKTYARFMLGRGIKNFSKCKDFHPDILREKGFDSLSWLNKRLYNNSSAEILPTLLRNYDRYSMANGVEIRMPFMDYRIVRFAFALEWKAKMHGGYTKAIIRDALKDIMPIEIIERKSKLGFNTPINEWWYSDFKEWIIDTVNSQAFLQSTILQDSKKVRQEIMNSYIKPYAGGKDVLWSKLNPYIWEQGFFIPAQRGLVVDCSR